MRRLDHKKAAERLAYEARVDWHARLPLGAKALLLCGAALVASACWLFQLAGAQCFVAFRITDDIDLRAILRPATLVPESKRLNVLLRDFREKRNHMAVVIDEYGGAAGLITIEDILEQIVGDIEDEYDEEDDLPIRKIADNDYVVKALTPIEDFNEHFGAALNHDEFDTIGGLLLQSFGHLPSRNEVAQLDRFEFKVVNADHRQIHLLRMRQLPES